MRMIPTLLASAAVALATSAAAYATEKTHWLILGHFAEDTAEIPRLTAMAPKIYGAMVKEGLTFGDRVTFVGTQGAPDAWFADFKLSAAAGKVKPEHLAAFLEQRLADFPRVSVADGGPNLWWSLDQVSSQANCTARQTRVVIVSNGFSASTQTADGRTSGAGLFPGSLEGCHVTMVGLAAYAPPGTSLKKRRELEQMFKLAIQAGGAASYGVLN